MADKKLLSEMTKEEIDGISTQVIGETYGVNWKGKKKDAVVKDAIELEGKEIDPEKKIIALEEQDPPEDITPEEAANLPTGKSPGEEEKAVTIPTDDTNLSRIQQEISGYVKTAKKEPPKITDIQDLFTRIEMEVPKGVKRGPEYDYCWLSIEDLSSISGTKWEIVNRSNHSHAPQRLFDRAGAILYKGQNILAFCYREVRELEQAAIIKAFNDKTDSMTAKKDRASEHEVRNIPITAAGGVVNSSFVNTETDGSGNVTVINDDDF